MENVMEDDRPVFDQSLDEYIKQNPGMFWTPLRRNHNRNQRYRRNVRGQFRQQQQQQRRRQHQQQQQPEQQQSSQRHHSFLHRTQNRDLNVSVQVLDPLSAPWKELLNMTEQLLVQQPMAQQQQPNVFQLGQRQVTTSLNGFGCCIRIGDGLQLPLQQQQQQRNLQQQHLSNNGSGSGFSVSIGGSSLYSPASRKVIFRPSPLSAIQQRLQQVGSRNPVGSLPNTFSQLSFSDNNENN